ncbi:MAG: hypothetical protein WC453_04475 [Patescibacteria group bacterium]
MPNSDEVLELTEEAEHLRLPEINVESLTANNSQSLQATLKFYQKSGLSFSGQCTPSVDVHPYSLKREARFRDIFPAVGDDNLDNQCLTTEQSALYISQRRHRIVEKGYATCCFLSKEADQYKVICISLWPSWFENIKIGFSRHAIAVPFKVLHINLTGADSQEDCLGLIGRGNAIIQTFPWDDPNLLSPEMNIIVLRSS